MDISSGVQRARQSQVAARRGRAVGILQPFVIVLQQYGLVDACLEVACF